ncbi:MAG: hypothetical protein GY754_24865 [bacterium]|nr:hypothetical protein [bacterium]
MVVAEIKPIQNITEMLRPYTRILNTGCAGCTALCLAGGQREVDELNSALRTYLKKENQPVTIAGYTIERQCEVEFIEELDSQVEKYDVILSMACGAGVQFLAERYPNMPVFPALNTTFIGVNRDIGWYEERCRSCGDCQLAYTGGICPVTMCAKSLFNGPCGGTHKGSCEVDRDIDCAWLAIYERLKAQNRLNNLNAIRKPMNWGNQVRGSVVKSR